MSNILSESLSSGPFLEKLRLNEKKYTSLRESKSLIAIYEEYVFVWHDAESCFLTKQMSTAEVKNTACLSLTLTNPPVFDVDTLLFNHTGSLMAMGGRNGVMIYEVPWRYGKFTCIANRDTITGRSWNIDECFYVGSKKSCVVQVLWHPGSPSNSHLAILTTDNYIRTYDVTNPRTPVQVLGVGGSRSSFLSSQSKISFSTCLGENPVSFDFGPSEELQVPQGKKSSRTVKSYETVVVWPIYLLLGNGDVYLIKAPLREELGAVSQVMGPLTMYPPSEDNYGYDTCHLLCLHTTPCSLVIATATGLLYHCIVLENREEEKQNEAQSFGLHVVDADVSLFVFESVELPLMMLSDEQDQAFTAHPLRLYRDVSSPSKYHCTHASGVHSVALPFLRAIEEAMDTGDLERLLGDEGVSPPSSIVEHLLCTRPLSQAEGVPVLGLDVSVSDGGGVVMVCLLASWHFVCLPLVPSYLSSKPHLLSSECVSSSSSSQGEQQILQRSICCPLLHSSLTVDSSPQQWLSLLCNVTQRYREDYIQRLNTAQALLRSRVKVLSQQKEYQLRDIEKTQGERDALREGAERLAEKYEDANSNQQRILKRIECVLQRFQQNLPFLSKAEVSMKQQLVGYEERLRAFEVSLEQIKKKLKQQKEKRQPEEQGGATRTETLNLNETQIKHMKELLTQEGGSIGELVKSVTSMKKQLGS